MKLTRLALPTPKRVAVKAADTFVSRDDFGYGILPRTLYNYGRDVQQGYDSNVVMAPVMWIMRTFTEAVARVESKTNSVWRMVEDHLAEILVDQPNPFYDGDTLFKATSVSYTLNGNAYWRKVRNRFGDVIQLWYTPHWLIQPKWPDDGSQFISHYEYRPANGKPVNLNVRDVVHFRFGLDPRNTRLGLSPLHALLREVFVDDEAAAFTAKVLENHGVGGLSVSPDSDAFRPSPEELDKLKAYLATAFSGDNRGSTMVFGVPTKVEQIGVDPQKMTLAALRNVSEERVCAALGIPASVVGFGAGNESTGVGATMREQRRLAWVQCLIPMQATMAKQLTAQLLPDFQSQIRRFRFRFDMSNVSTFQEEQDLTATRSATLVNGGILRVDRAQEICGLEVDENMKYYYRPANTILVDEFGNKVIEEEPEEEVEGQDNDRGDEEDQLAAAVARRMNGGNGKKPDEED